MFRRSINLGQRDITDVGGVSVDREFNVSNSRPLTLFRYFLEPLGVAVDKWSMNVRGRSRAYSFADVLTNNLSTLADALEADLAVRPPRGFAAPFAATRANIMTAVNNTLAPALLPDASDVGANVPTFTDVQRIFNKACIECHGGLNYPPYYNHSTYLKFAEREVPHVPALLDPLWDRWWTRIARRPIIRRPSST